MGADLVGYLSSKHVDQRRIKEIFAELTKDVNTEKDHQAVDQYLVEKGINSVNGSNNIHVYDGYNEALDFYIPCVMFGYNYIEREPRFNSRYLQSLVTNENQRHIPVLNEIYIHDAQSAESVSQALIAVFGESDCNFASFAEWLRKTAKYCDSYEIER